MIVATIETNVKQVLKSLSNTENRLRSFQTPLKESGLIMIRSTDKNFKAGGRPNKWEALKSSTIERKGSSGILLDTGTLKNSFTYKVSSKTVAIGTSVKYGPFHQFGTKDIPKREFLLFQEEDKKIIDKVFTKHINAILKKK